MSMPKTETKHLLNSKIRIGENSRLYILKTPNQKYNSQHLSGSCKRIKSIEITYIKNKNDRRMTSLSGIFIYKSSERRKN